jgi:hypothetical protein
MRLRIDGTRFGSITIDGQEFDQDVVIRLDKEVIQRKKELSKALYGTSHTLSLEEAKHIYDRGALRLIVGTGQYGLVTLSDEAAAYLARKECAVDMLPTPLAIEAWNEAEGAVIAVFHVTC